MLRSGKDEWKSFGYFRIPTWLKLTVVASILFLSVLFLINWWVQIDIAQTTYLRKAGVDWWNDIFLLKGDFIFLCLLVPLLAIDPRIRHSKILGLMRQLTWTFAWARLRERWHKVTEGPIFDDRFSWRTGLAWQATTYLFFFLLCWITGAFNLAFLFHMARSGVGNLDPTTLLRIFLFPVNPPGSDELVALTPTIETWYQIIITCLSIIIFVWIIRLVLGGIGNLVAGGVGRGMRNFVAAASLFVSWLLLRAPFSEFDITSPHSWYILLALELTGITATTILHLHREELLFNRKQVITYSVVFGIVLIVLVANIGAILIYRLQWDRSWLQYEWYPKTVKEIEYTRWAAGITQWQRKSLSEAGAENNTAILSRVRQWDYDASLTKMQSQIGVNWLTLADSDIIYLNNREYWVCPTTINYEIARDWISRHFTYTHAPRVVVIDSHNGSFVQPESAFNLSEMPKIYYGEGLDLAYVRVPGFTEIGNTTYQGDSDYVLRGWIRAWWFSLQGQFGFVFNPPTDEVQMLWNRDVMSRVEKMLIKNLRVDDDVYLVTDGERLYYCVQVLVDYPLSSQFAFGDYLRFLGMVLVDVENGQMKGYSVEGSDGFLLDFYKSFYGWQPMPSWLKSQIRVPESLYERQMEIDYRYHVQDPTIWRSRSDDFERPSETDVYYILTTINGRTSFAAVQVVEFKQAAGKNLAGLYISPCGADYGSTSLYRVPSEQKIIGPSVALQALETDNTVRSRLSLLQTYRFGNILLYNIRGRLYYFTPVYTEVAVGQAVIAKIAFICCVDASTGENVAMGEDAFSAYNSLVQAPSVGEEERLEKMDSLFTSVGIDVNSKVTSIHGNIEICEGMSTYVTEDQWGNVQASIQAFVEGFCVPNGVTTVYRWATIENSMKYANYGFLVNDRGTVTLHYVRIEYG